MSWFMSRRRLAAENEVLRLEVARLREQAMGISIVNTCLTDDLTAARARLAEFGGRRTVPEVPEEHDVHRKALADALGDQQRHLNWDQLIAGVVRLNGAAEAWMADHAAEKRRADGLQARLDDALGLNEYDVQAGARWQETRADKKVRP